MARKYDKTGPFDGFVKPGKGMESRVYVQDASQVPVGYEARRDSSGDLYYIAFGQAPPAHTGARELVETRSGFGIYYFPEQDHYVVGNGINAGRPISSLQAARSEADDLASEFGTFG